MRHIAAALLLGASPAAAALKTVTPAPVPPLAALAPALTAALAGVASLTPTLPSAPSAVPLPRPASMDTVRAQVLVQRAAALGFIPEAVAAPAQAPAASPVASPAPAPERAPAKALEAVNAVLKEVTPGRLAGMSAGELHAVSGLILEAMSGAAPRPRAEAVRVLSEASAERLRPMVGRPALERSLYKPGDDRHEEVVEVRGLPEGARILRADGSEVFRHYTTEEGAKAIAARGGLWNGFVSYVQRSPGLWKKVFIDLNGLFLTKPGVAGDQVGVPASQFPRYVDIRVPAGLPLVELEPGRILLIPLPARTRGWIADLYRRWTAGGEVSSAYADTVRGLDSTGGPGPDLSVPVEVVAAGKAR